MITQFIEKVNTPETVQIQTRLTYVFYRFRPQAHRCGAHYKPKGKHEFALKHNRGNIML